MPSSEKKERRMLRTFVVGISPAFFLAVAYVWLGMPLIESPLYKKINLYAFGITGLVSLGTVLGYFLRYRDITETISLVAWIVWSLTSLMEDIFVYIVCLPLGKCQLRMSLPWLDGHPAGIISQMVGFEHTNSVIVVLFVVVTGALMFGVTEVLFEVEADDRFINKVL